MANEELFGAVPEGGEGGPGNRRWQEKVRESGVNPYGSLEESNIGDPSLANEWRYMAFEQENAQREAMEDYRNRVRGGEASAALGQRRLDMADAQRRGAALQGTSRGDAIAMRQSAYGGGAAQGAALAAGMKRRAAEIAAAEAQYQQSLGRYAGIEGAILKRSTAFDRYNMGLQETMNQIGTDRARHEAAMRRNMTAAGISAAGALGSAAAGAGGGGGYYGSSDGYNSGGGGSDYIDREAPDF